MYIRIRISRETGDELVKVLRQSYKSGDINMVKRLSALVGLSRGESVHDVAATLGIAAASIYRWLNELLVEGVNGLKPHWAGGRPTKLTATQKKRLTELIKAGPQAAGFQTGCWNSALVQELIHHEFGVLYNVHYVCELLKNLGFSFQKARFVSDHLDEVRRQAWLSRTWPTILAQAEAAGGLLLFGDEASFAQWGSLGYTWAVRGQQPVVKTSGKRKGYKVFGLIDFFSGRVFSEGITGKFTSETYIAFLKRVLQDTPAPIFLIQDGARYHTSKTTRAFFQANVKRLRVFQLPSYSPDYNPIEYLWRAVKGEATHLKYFPAFQNLITSVQDALTYFKTEPQRVKALFGLYLKQMAQPLTPAIPWPIAA
jgi:transposase